jgi:hypothetical protein
LPTKSHQQNQTGITPPPQAKTGSKKTQAETEIVEHSHPRLRSVQTQATKSHQQNQTGTTPPPQAEIGGAKTQAKTEIVEHSYPRLRSVQTQAQAKTHADAPPGREPRRQAQATPFRASIENSTESPTIERAKREERAERK